MKKSEILNKLEHRINNWYQNLPGCADKECYVCTKYKNELDEALNLIQSLRSK